MIRTPRFPSAPLGCLPLAALVLLALAGNAVAQPVSEPAAATAPAFDAALAAELGADERGMRRYVMALLKAGPNRDQDAETAAALQRGHMENIGRLAAEGSLVLAGPFMHGGELRGIYVFDVEDVEAARRLTESDPAIQAGRLVMELYPWYGSAALRKVTSIHQRISRADP